LASLERAERVKRDGIVTRAPPEEIGRAAAEHQVAQGERGRRRLADTDRVSRQHDTGFLALLNREAIFVLSRWHVYRRAPNEMLPRRNGGRGDEVASRIQRGDDLLVTIGRDEPHSHRVEKASGDRYRLETRAGNSIGDLHHAAGRIVTDREDLRADLEL